MADRLLGRRHEELVHRALGTVRQAVEAIREPAADVAAQHLGLHQGPGQVALRLGAESRRLLVHHIRQLVDELAVARHVAELARLALVAHDGHGQSPALTGCTDHVGGVDPGAVEQDLAELAGDPVDHLEWSLLNGGLAHRHDEGGDPAVLRDVSIGAGQHQAPVGRVRVARPHLVARDHVLRAVPHGAGAQRRQIGSGVGLAEALTPALAAAHQSGQEAALHVSVPVPQEPLHQVAHARARWRAGCDQLLVEDDLVHAGQAVPTDLGRPGQAEEAGVVERLVPGGLAGPVLVRRRGRGESGVVLAAARRAAGGGTRAPRGNQRSPSSPPMPRAASTRARLGPTPPSTSVERRARRRKTWARHSQVLPMPPCT